MMLLKLIVGTAESCLVHKQSPVCHCNPSHNLVSCIGPMPDYMTATENCANYAVDVALDF